MPRDVDQQRDSSKHKRVTTQRFQSARPLRAPLLLLLLAGQTAIPGPEEPGNPRHNSPSRRLLDWAVGYPRPRRT